MKCLGAVAEDGNAVAEGSLRLKVLVAYEDLETGLRARQTLDQTVQRLEADADVQVNLWRFDLLREPALRQRAAKEAAEADMVFVSAHGQWELPATVNLWFLEWFARKGGEPCALAMSFDADAKDTPSTSQMVEALGAAARLAGVDVFLPVGEAQTELESRIESIQRRAETRTMPLDAVLHWAERHPFCDWGINE